MLFLSPLTIQELSRLSSCNIEALFSFSGSHLVGLSTHQLSFQYIHFEYIKFAAILCNPKFQFHLKIYCYFSFFIGQILN
jgi:ABC-type transport system involved in Fe-S cluster assembly fused permease/ATPase subunit